MTLATLFPVSCSPEKNFFSIVMAGNKRKNIFFSQEKCLRGPELVRTTLVKDTEAFFLEEFTC